MATPAAPDTTNKIGSTTDESKGGLFNTGDSVILSTLSTAIAADVTAAQASADSAAASATTATEQAALAAASFDEFDDRYLGSKSSDPSVDNDGNALLTGALYFNSSDNLIKSWTGSAWILIKPTTTEQGHINTVSGIAGNVTKVANIDANVTKVADIDANVTKVANIDANVTKVANIDSNVTTVAGIDSDVTTVAGKATEIGRLGTTQAVADMLALGTSQNVTNMNNLNGTNVITHMNNLGTSTNVTNMANLNASGVISNIAALNASGVISNIATVAGIDSDVTAVAGKATEVGRLGTTQAVADMLALGTSQNVTNMNNLNGTNVITHMNNLGTSANVTNMANLNGTNVITHMANLNGTNVISNMAALNASGVISNIGVVASNVSHVEDVADDIANVNTVATNITNVNTFANTYFIASSAPTGGTVGEGDLWYDTANDEMKVHNGSSFVTFISTYNTGNLSEGSNLYYTNARADARITNAFNSNVTLAGELRGPATFVIDPAVVGNNTGLVQIKGNLQVDGTTTTVNSQTLDVADKNITVANGAANKGAADGGGLTVDCGSDTDATLTYASSDDTWNVNKTFKVNSAEVATQGFAVAMAIAL